MSEISPVPPPEETTYTMATDPSTPRPEYTTGPEAEATFDPTTVMDMADLLRRQQRMGGMFRPEVGKHAEVASRPELLAWCAEQDATGNWIVPIHIDQAPALAAEASQPRQGWLARRATRARRSAESEQGIAHTITGRAQPDANTRQRLGRPLTEEEQANVDRISGGQSRAEMRTGRHSRAASIMGGLAIERSNRNRTTGEILDHFRQQGAVDPNVVRTFREDYQDSLVSLVADLHDAADATGQPFDADRAMVQLSGPLYREMQARLFGSTRTGIERQFEVPRVIIEEFDGLFTQIEDEPQPPTQEMPITPPPAAPRPAPGLSPGSGHATTEAPVYGLGAGPAYTRPGPRDESDPDEPAAEPAASNQEQAAGPAFDERLRQEIMDVRSQLEEQGIAPEKLDKKTFTRLMLKYKDTSHEAAQFLTTHFHDLINTKQGDYKDNSQHHRR